MRDSQTKEPPKWTKPQSSKGKGKFAPRAHQANVAEMDDEEEQYEEEEYPEEQQDIAEVLKAEVEGFFDELQALGESAESLWEPEDASNVESACAALAEASEALQTVRDAKEALRRRVTPSKGKGKGKTKSKTKAKGSVGDNAKRIADRKKTSTCRSAVSLAIGVVTLSAA